MFRLSANKISLAASALLLCAGFAQAQTTEPVSPLAAAPTSVSVAFTLPSTVGTAVPVGLSVTSGSYAFVIDPTTVPFWLSLGAMSGTASTTPVSVSFQASTTAGTLAGGIYTASVHVRISGFQDLVVPVTLSVNEPGSTLTVATTPTETSGTVDLTYTAGSTTYPTATISVLSSDQPVAFTASGAVTSPAAPANWIQISAASGIAYNFGTPLTVTFLKDVLQNANVGDILTATVTISYGSGPTTIPVPIQITVLQPYATLSSAAPLFPAAAPLQAAGSLKVVVTGSGFYAAGTGISPTVVKIAYGAVPATALTGITSAAGAQTGSVTVVNPTTMILSIPYEDATPVDILSVAQPITISINSGLSGETAVTTSLNITASPIIYSVTDGAALEEAAPGASPKFAPYELVTIFGANFCPSACASPVVGAVGAESRYPSSLTIGGAALSVAFNNQSGTLIANAFLLFATDNQINALVPSTIIGTTITGLQIVVTSGANPSAPYLALPVAANPGIFTTAASGQGPGAVLLGTDYSVNSSTNPALVGGSVLIYVTGLGAPNSTAASITSTKAPTFPTSCFATSSYVTGEGLTSPATADGAVLVSSVWGTGNLPPCFATKGYVSVTIGGVAATVTYSGWVADSVTGLYQINATIPKATTSTTAVALPLVVTVGTGTSAVTSQTGVTVAVKL
jgi:uncharacterized protein (TIGR03437 family)